MMKCWKRMAAVLGMTVVLAAGSVVTAFAASSTSTGMDWNSGVITATGEGVPPENARSQAQARVLARRAAVVAAYRNLAEEVKGVDITGETTVQDAMVTSDTATTKVSAFIQGARIVSEKMLPDGSYQVTMQVSAYGVSNSLASAVLEKPAQQESFPQPVASVEPTPASALNVNIAIGTGAAAGSTTTTPVTPVTPTQLPSITGPTTDSTGSPAASTPSGRAIGGYTGLIVDCRGLGLKPVMSPVIKNEEGTPIYGYKNLNYDAVISKGMASYATSLSDATRAGSNPLFVKALSVTNHNGDPVISVADANRVLIENGATGFLDQTNVVFLR